MDKTNQVGPRMKKPLLLWITLLVVLIGLGAGAAWWFTQPHTAEA